MECVLDKIIAYADNPMLRITIPTSLQTKKKVEAFEVEEQRLELENQELQTIISKLIYHNMSLLLIEHYHRKMEKL